MTKDIQLVNENGTIVGRDPATGNKIPISFESVEAGALTGSWDTLVTSSSELESAFDNLSGGETVAVAQPDTPYRTTQWLDIDADGVEIRFESRFAINGDPIVKPEDGADVGGIRIGTNSSVEEVAIKNFGFHGNESTMDDSVKRCHAILVDDTEDVQIKNVYATRTHPYHEHHSGGSGISIRADSIDTTVEKVRVNEIGDNGVRTAGNVQTVERVYSTNGYDRAVSLHCTPPDDLVYHPSNVEVRKVTGKNHSDGSIVGLGSTTNASENEPIKNITIDGVKAVDGFRSAVTFNGYDFDVSNVTIQNVTAHGGDRRGINIQNADNVTVSGFTLSDVGSEDYPDGVRVTGPDRNVEISDGVVVDSHGTGVMIMCEDVTVRGVTVENAGADGINGNGEANVGAFNCRVYGSTDSDITGFGGTGAEEANNIIA